jgi:hypothetical protein
MEADAIREACRRQPFQPFKLKMVDGSEIAIRHRDYISFSPNGRRVAVFGEDGAMSMLESLLIMSIELPAPAEDASPKPTNGNPQ